MATYVAASLLARSPSIVATALNIWIPLGPGMSGPTPFSLVWLPAGVTLGTSSVYIYNSTLPAGVTGVAYSQTLTAHGGTSPYTFSVTSGSLPAGLSLAGSTGAITGTPTGTGTSSFTVTVHDSASGTSAQAFSIAVSAALGANSGFVA